MSMSYEQNHDIKTVKEFFENVAELESLGIVVTNQSCMRLGIMPETRLIRRSSFVPESFFLPFDM